MQLERRPGVSTKLAAAAAIVLVAVTVAGYGLLQSRPPTSSESSSSRQPCGGAASVSQSAGQSSLQISVGGPATTTFHFESFNTSGGGQSTFDGWEELSVYVHSNVTTNVLLGTSNVPSGVWAKFDPSCLRNVGPDGARTSLLIAGALTPTVSEPHSQAAKTNASLAIMASPVTGQPTSITLPIVQQSNVTVLQSPGPVVPQGAQSSLGGYTEGNTSEIFGAVYDPTTTQGSQPLSVSLLATGLLENGSEVPLPSWMQVELPQSSFTLNASEPYYFEVGIATVPPHFGSYTIFLREVVGGQPFNEEVAIETHAVASFGGKA